MHLHEEMKGKTVLQVPKTPKYVFMGEVRVLTREWHVLLHKKIWVNNIFECFAIGKYYNPGCTMTSQVSKMDYERKQDQLRKQSKDFKKKQKQLRNIHSSKEGRLES